MIQPFVDANDMFMREGRGDGEMERGDGEMDMGRGGRGE